jgi:hypothetical protein
MTCCESPRHERESPGCRRGAHRGPARRKAFSAQRAEVLAQIDASPEAFEAYADAIAILRDTEGEQPHQPPRPSDDIAQVALARRFGKRRAIGAGVGLALAAAIVFALVTPTLRSRSEPDGLPAPGLLLQSLSQLEDSRSIIGQSAPWTEVRGGGDGLTARARAIRIGVRAFDLEALVERGDSASRLIALEIAALIDGFPGGAPAAAAFRSVASGQPTRSGVDAALLAADGIVSGDDMRVGAWIEAARVAAAARDREFFHAAPLALLRATMGRIGDIPDGTTQLLRQIEVSVQSESPDWVAIQRDLDALLRLLAA